MVCIIVYVSRVILISLSFSYLFFVAHSIEPYYLNSQATTLSVPSLYITSLYVSTVLPRKASLPVAFASKNAAPLVCYYYYVISINYRMSYFLKSSRCLVTIASHYSYASFGIDNSIVSRNNQTFAAICIIYTSSRPRYLRMLLPLHVLWFH